MLKKYRPFIISYYAITVISLIVAAFYDLKLDIMLNNPTNPFAIWFCNTGEMPSRLICPIAGIILIKTAKSKLEKFAGYIIELGGSAYLGFHIADYFFVEENKILFGIAYGLGFGLVLLYLSKFVKIQKRFVKPLRTLAITGVIVMFAQLIVIEGSKYLWGRVRFRDLLKQGSYDAFTPWYKINGINGNKSFPSGHTAGAGMSYLLMFVPFIDKNKEKKYPLYFIIPMIYTAVVAFTRLVMGAHYLSDVTVGGAVSFTIVIIAMCIYDKKHSKI